MEDLNFSNISFEMPKNQSNVIKVIGVGGGGSNAVNHMFSQGITGVDFVICNTDAQALQNSPIPNKIQLGATLTEGLGAGANPEVGEQSAIESLEEIKTMLTTNTKMVFITVGMGGGTGTGAAPVIAKIAKDLDLLTIGIVTMPFSFEGKTRNEQALIGVEKLRSCVDSLVVINNNKLRAVYGNLGFKAGFSKADEVLSTAARGIAEVITHHYTQNIDLRDAKTVLSNSGTAIMGSATAEGANRAQEAITRALDSPLLNDNRITGAKNVLLLIVSGVQEITIDEIGEINDYIQTEAKSNVNIIMGIGDDEALGDAIAVTIVATGFHKDQQHEISNIEAKKIVHTLEDEQEMVYNFSSNTPLDSEEVNNTSEKIIHNLEEIEETVEMDLIATSEIIKNIDVVYEEVAVAVENLDEFVITSVVEKEADTKEETADVQTTFTFDLPLAKQEKINDIPVSFDEVKPSSKEEIVHFNLEAYETLEETLNVAKNEQSKPEGNEEMNFELRIEPTVSKATETKDFEDASPLNLTISELKKTAEVRKQKLKDFNYKFSNNVHQNIDEIEKEPAYKRMGVDLKETPHSSETTQSRTTLGVDDNDGIQLRSNNSFLHDNVD